MFPKYAHGMDIANYFTVPIILRSTTGVTCGAGIAYPSGAPEFTTRLKESPVLIFCMDFDNYFTVSILP